MLGILSFLALLGALTVGTLRRPSVALAGILCLYGLKQWGQNSTAFFAQHRTVANLSIGILVLLAVAIRASRGHCLFCRLTRTSWLVFALYAYAFISLTWTPNMDEGLRQWGLTIPYIFTIVVLAPLVIDTTDDIRAAFNWTLIIGTFICALALFFGRWGSRGLLIFGDIFESQANALAIASLGGTILIIGTLSLQKDQKKWLRMFCLLAIPIGVAVVLRSLSRGQLIAAGLAILLAWPIAYRVKSVGSFFQFAAGFAILVVIGWLAFDLLQLDPKRWSGEQGADDAEGRFNAAAGLLAFALSNPLTLVFGLGNSSAFHYVGFYPHIALLEVLAEEGIVGFSLFASVMALAVRSVRRFVANVDGSVDRLPRPTIAVLSAVFIFELLLTFKQGSLLSCTYAFAYAMLLHKLAENIGRQEATATTGISRPVQSAAVRYSNLLR